MCSLLCVLYMMGTWRCICAYAVHREWQERRVNRGPQLIFASGPPKGLIWSWIQLPIFNRTLHITILISFAITVYVAPPLCMPSETQRLTLPQHHNHCWLLRYGVIFCQHFVFSPSFNVNQPVKWNVLFWSCSWNLFAQQINGHTSKQTWSLSKYLSMQEDCT